MSKTAPAAEPAPPLPRDPDVAAALAAPPRPPGPGCYIRDPVTGALTPDPAWLAEIEKGKAHAARMAEGARKAEEDRK